MDTKPICIHTGNDHSNYKLDIFITQLVKDNRQYTCYGVSPGASQCRLHVTSVITCTVVASSTGSQSAPRYSEYGLGQGHPVAICSGGIGYRAIEGGGMSIRSEARTNRPYQIRSSVLPQAYSLPAAGLREYRFGPL